MNENKYQMYLKKYLTMCIPGCIVLKNDPEMIQGIPDLIVLYRDKWVALEVKKSKKAKHRPNQDYYISIMNEMAYASFIYPENEEEVVDDIKKFFGVYEPTRRAYVRPGLKSKDRSGKARSNIKR